MATKTDIANLVLTAHGGAWFGDIDSDPGGTADAIRAVWTTSVERALAAHPWKFAKWTWRDQPALIAAENPDPDMPFAYRLPSDCGRVFETRPRLPFNEWQRAVASAEGPALTLIGTRRASAVDLGMFPALFNDYLAALIAFRICTPVSASEAIRKRCRDELATAFADAASDNGRAGTVHRVAPDSFMAARRGGGRIA